MNVLAIDGFVLMAGAAIILFGRALTAGTIHEKKRRKPTERDIARMLAEQAAREQKRGE
jgi:hypothetical protein